MSCRIPLGHLTGEVRVSYRVLVGSVSYRVLVGSVSYRVSVKSVSYRVLVGSEGVGVSVLQSHTHHWC